MRVSLVPSLLHDGQMAATVRQRQPLLGPWASALATLLLLLAAQARAAGPLGGKLVSSERIVDVATGRSSALRMIQKGLVIRRARLSPDGRALALVCDRRFWNDGIEGTKVQLWLKDVRGRREKMLLENLGSFASPIWSPDGRFLLVAPYGLMFQTLIEVKTGRIWRTSVHYLHGVKSLLGWSADGRRIWFQSESDAVETPADNSLLSAGIFEAGLDGGDHRRVRRFHDGETCQLSPGATAVACVHARGQLHSFALAGAEEHVWAEKRVIAEPVWSPDARWVGAPQEGELKLWNVGTNEERTLPFKVDDDPLQWWSPPVGPPPDCRPLVTALLGPGRVPPAPLEAAALEADEWDVVRRGDPRLRAGVTRTPQEIWLCRLEEMRNAVQEDRWAGPAGGVARVPLRAAPGNRSASELEGELQRSNLFGQGNRARGCFVNVYRDKGDGTVSDLATGLAWQRGGSPKPLSLAEARAYVQTLNRQRFSGHDDWRLPTVAEAASILEWNHGEGDSPNYAPFEATGGYESFWSANREPATGSEWTVDLGLGSLFPLPDRASSAVKVVRSLPEAGP